jgi:putative GTP pyrophosphokinase
LQIKIYLYDRIELIPVEIQIRTIAMDFWASLEHHLKYKSDSKIPKSLKDRLTNCSDVITKLDEEMQLIYKEVRKLDN